MDEKERAKIELENRLLKIERTLQELLLHHIEGKLEERKDIITLLDLGDLDDMERQPGLV